MASRFATVLKDTILEVNAKRDKFWLAEWFTGR